MIHVALVTSAVLGTVIVLLVAFLVVRRMQLAREARMETQLRARLRPIVAEWLADPMEPAPAELRDATSSRERDVVSTLLARYGGMLRGASRERITAYVATQGYVEAAIADTRAWRAWRRGRGARALGYFGSARAVRQLAALLVRDRDPAVRLAAARALGRIDDYKSAAALLIALPTGSVPIGVIAQSLLDLGDHAFHALVSACDDEDDPTRAMACRLLGLIGAAGSPDARRAAHAVLQRRGRADADPQVRAAAVRSLAQLGDTTSKPVVAAALRAESADVRRAGAVAASSLYLRDLAPELVHVVEQALEGGAAGPDWRLARTAAHAWAQLADELDPQVFDASTRAQALPFLREAASAAYRELTA